MLTALSGLCILKMASHRLFECNVALQRSSFPTWEHSHSPTILLLRKCHRNRFQAFQVWAAASGDGEMGEVKEDWRESREAKLILKLWKLRLVAWFISPCDLSENEMESLWKMKILIWVSGESLYDCLRAVANSAEREPDDRPFVWHNFGNANGT